MLAQLATASYGVVISQCLTDDSRIGPGTGPALDLAHPVQFGGAQDGSVVSNCILGEKQSEKSTLKYNAGSKNGRTCAPRAKKRH